MNITAETSPYLKDLPGIRHGFYGRKGGVSQGIFEGLNCGRGSRDDQTHVAENRRRVTRSLRANHLQVCRQVHSARAYILNGPVPLEMQPDSDALVTNIPGLAIAALSADCGTVLLADPTARVIAAAHAGWKGAVSGILDNMIEAMEQLGAMRGHIVGGIGPCIHPESYEVGPEFPDVLYGHDPVTQHFLSASPTKPNHHHFDLPGYILGRLRRAGIEHISPSPADTYGNENTYFSYRRDVTHRKQPCYGRHISAIALIA
jgi:polyphenol oxidase